MRVVTASRSLRALIAACGLLAASGCGGGQSGGVPAPAPLSPSASAVQSAPASVAAAPAAQSVALPPAVFASGVKSKTEKLSSSGGKLTLPGLSSLKGSFGYTGNDANPGATVALSASLTNAFNAPTPPSANIVYFLQAVLNSNQFFITFNAGNEKAKVAGSLLDPAKTYTLYVYVPSISNQPLDTISAGSPNAKHQLEFTSPFSGATLPTKTIAILELGES